MADIQQAYIQYEESENVNIRYKFDIITSEELSMESQVTEHVVEDGSMRQEHTVLPPIEITLQGIVAEKTYWHEPLVVDSFIAQWAGKLQPIAAFLPEVSSYAQTAIAAANYIERNVRQTVDKIKRLWKWDLSKATQTEMQKQVVGELRVLRHNRTLVDVTTAFGTFRNMLIESARITQEETTSQSQLVIKLKQYNSVATEVVYINMQDYLSRCAQQAAAEENLGRIQGENKSTLRGLVSPNIVPYFTGVN